jgi:hypothetical protein
MIHSKGSTKIYETKHGPFLVPRDAILEGAEKKFTAYD